MINGEKIIISPGNGKGLGDIIVLTAICDILKSIDEVHLSPSSEKFKFFFENYDCSIIINSSPPQMKSIGSGNFIERCLKPILKDKTPIIYYPKIYVKYDDNLKWAIEYSNQYSKPILIFNVNGNPGWKKTHHNKEFDKEEEILIFQKCLNFLSNEYTIIQTGLSSNFSKYYTNVILLEDLPIEKLTALYYISKLYFGIPTGDSHLMLAVGGKTLLVHKNTGEGQHLLNEWGYKGNRFKGIFLSDLENIIFNKNFL